jgi:hypothetical protein
VVAGVPALTEIVPSARIAAVATSSDRVRALMATSC